MTPINRGHHRLKFVQPHSFSFIKRKSLSHHRLPHPPLSPPTDCPSPSPRQQQPPTPSPPISPLSPLPSRRSALLPHLPTAAPPHLSPSIITSSAFLHRRQPLHRRSPSPPAPPSLPIIIIISINQPLSISTTSTDHHLHHHSRPSPPREPKLQQPPSLSFISDAAAVHLLRSSSSCCHRLLHHHHLSSPSSSSSSRGSQEQPPIIIDHPSCVSFSPIIEKVCRSFLCTRREISILGIVADHRHELPNLDMHHLLFFSIAVRNRPFFGGCRCSFLHPYHRIKVVRNLIINHLIGMNC